MQFRLRTTQYSLVSVKSRHKANKQSIENSSCFKTLFDSFFLNSKVQALEVLFNSIQLMHAFVNLPKYYDDFNKTHFKQVSSWR